MPAPKKAKVENGFYHIYNKCVENRNLFNDEEDYRIFIKYLIDYLTPPPDPKNIKKTFSVNGRIYKGVPRQPKNYFNKIELTAYNLAPGHFHLLVKQLSRGSLEKLVRSLSTRYAIYYNKKYKRTGSLFAGPYKSVKINDSLKLLLLTRHLHREHIKLGSKRDEKYSSYQVYLQGDENSWVKPQVVLTYFEKSENEKFKGISGYQNFVEKYQLQEKQEEILSGIIIEKQPKQVEQKIKEDVKRKASSKDPPYQISKKPRSRVPEFAFTAAAVFILLFSIGYRNVRISEAQSLSSVSSLPSPVPVVTPVPAVSGVEDQKPEEEPKEEEIIEKEPEKEIVSKEPENTLKVVITDESPSVNIRKKPTTSSGKLGEANDGDIFEFVEQKLGWYQIILEDGSDAYLSARYVSVIKETRKN